MSGTLFDPPGATVKVHGVHLGMAVDLLAALLAYMVYEAIGKQRRIPFTAIVFQDGKATKLASVAAVDQALTLWVSLWTRAVPITWPEPFNLSKK